ncbi:MAG: hypothetical protein HZB15_13755 [Actinobacteria bacterium]|nr:hypothetical protein [Actinomycetota bacterium]
MSPGSRLRLVAGSAALVVACAACAPGDDDSRAVIEGTLTLRATDNIDGGWDDCRGTEEYDDVGPGMAVTILDPAGDTIGAGRTRSLRGGDQDGRGVIAQAARAAEVADGTSCTVSFSVGVNDAETFRIQVGSRGDRRASRSELARTQWFVEFEVG